MERLYPFWIAGKTCSDYETNLRLTRRNLNGICKHVQTKQNLLAVRFRLWLVSILAANIIVDPTQRQRVILYTCKTDITLDVHITRRKFCNLVAFGRTSARRRCLGLETIIKVIDGNKRYVHCA